MDSSESNPFNDLLSIGTPITGSGVRLATMPGKCAAPPAPAMMTRRPRAAAVRPYRAMSIGVRCAETTRAS